MAPNTEERDQLNWNEIKPQILVSRCLGFEACRWNGDMIRDELVQLLRPYVEFVTFCPECEVGLGVPRRPVRLVADANTSLDLRDQKVVTRLVQPATGADVTDAMIQSVGDFLNQCGLPDGVILKFRSPSCGPDQVRIYESAESNRVVGKGAGLFGQEIASRFPELPIEDEGRLRNFLIREHWLTAVFSIARLRHVSALAKMRYLVEFHASHKFLLMACNQEGLRRLGQIVAAGSEKTFAPTMEEYSKTFLRTITRPAQTPSRINAMMHIFGYFSKDISESEREYFLDLLEDYRRGAMPMCVPIALLKSWAERFDNDYIRQQTLLHPYPDDLAVLGDSGKGRELG